MYKKNNTIIFGTNEKIELFNSIILCHVLGEDHLKSFFNKQMKQQSITEMFN